MRTPFLSLSLISFLFFSSTSAQTIVKDAQGNYRSVKDTAKVSDLNTGKTFTDPKGNIWPVYQTKTGRVYALRVSKSGTQYKQYLDRPINKPILVDMKGVQLTN